MRGEGEGWRLIWLRWGARFFVEGRGHFWEFKLVWGQSRGWGADILGMRRAMRRGGGGGRGFILFGGYTFGMSIAPPCVVIFGASGDFGEAEADTGDL